MSSSSSPEQPKTKITVVDEKQTNQSSTSVGSNQGHQGTNNRAIITARIDNALKLYPKKVGSAVGSAENNNNNIDDTNLIQLQKEFQEFRRKLKELVIAAKQYPITLANADKARFEFVDKLKQLAIQSPVETMVVNAKETTSVAHIMKKASQHVKTQNQNYQQQILKYVMDWENTVTTRIDALTEENRKMHTRLDHYRNKVNNLRKNANKKMEAAAAKAPPPSPSATTSPNAGIPMRLKEKLERNEGKLDQSWKVHQRSSTNLCHVLEETTRQGWQELVPLLLEYLQWEMKRTANLSDTMIALAVVSQNIQQTSESERTKRLEYFEKIGGGGGNSSVASAGGNNKSHEEDNSGIASVLSDEVDDSSEGSDTV